MKTSHILVLALALFLIGTTGALFVFSKKHDEINRSLCRKEFPMPNIKVVVCEENSDLSIIQADKDVLNIECMSNEKIKRGCFRVYGDTLYVYSGYRMFLDCKNVQQVYANKNFSLGLFNLKANPLKVVLRGGNTYFQRNNSTETQLFNLEIAASDSGFVHINDSKIDCLSLQLDSAQFDFSGKAKKINAILKHHTSFKDYSNTTSLVINKDESSGFGYYEDFH